MRVTGTREKRNDPALLGNIIHFKDRIGHLTKWGKELGQKVV